jgi:hypothetical protein
LPRDGTYTVTATSYAPGVTGRYDLSFGLAEPGAAARAFVGANGQPRRVVGVFVGISDYPEGVNDLEYTAQDPQKIAETLRRNGMLAPETELLIDRRATRAALRAAFERVAANANPDDTFVFFFSGHGAQLDTDPTATEPDGLNETIELYDGAVTDDELAEMFGLVRNRVAIIAIDACYSGGFARDMVDRPGRMGLFSSEEDLTSMVADKFRAGGYLSHFLRSGLAGAADEDGDYLVTAGELSTYLRRQFREEVVNVEAETRDGQRNYQFLVIERGGVLINDPLVAARVPG